MNRGRRLRTLQVLLFAAALLAAAFVREWPSTVINQAIIWLPSGVATAGLWLLGLRFWWVVAACTAVQRGLLDYDVTMTLPAAAGSTAEAVVGVLVLRRLRFRAALDRLRDVLALFAAAAVAPVASILFSWLGRCFIWTDPEFPFYSNWDGWWRMNALGVLTVLPAVLTWTGIPRQERSARLVLAACVAAVVLPVLEVAAMSVVPQGTTGVMLIVVGLAPVVFYAAVRYGVRGAALTGSLSGLVLAIATTSGIGPFLGVPFADRHSTIQLLELMLVALPPAFGALISERQHAHDEAVRSDELRRSLRSALLDVTYRIASDGTCLDVSVPQGIHAPYTREELVGRSIFDHFPAERRESLTDAMRSAAARGEGLTLEYEIAAGGRRFVREARCVAHGPDEFLAVVRDITDRKWSEAAGAFETQVLEQVATGRPPAEVFRVLVEGMERLFPGSLASLLLLEGTRLHVAMAPSLPETYNAAIEGTEIGPERGSCGRAAALGITVIAEDIASAPPWRDFRHLAEPHGLRACWSVPIRGSNGAVLGTFAVYHREPRRPEPRELSLAERAGVLAGIVLERERSIAELRRSEDLIASINRNVKEGLFRATPDGRLLYANRPFATLFGFDSLEGVVGWLQERATEPPERRAELLRAMEEQGQWLNEEVLFRRRDGSTFWGMLSATGVRGADGRVEFFDGAIADVTARKELEEQLRQSQKMEAVGKLAGGVAHDFNNLLTVIFGYAQNIRAEAGAQPGLGGFAEQILDAARRASGLTRQLLAYSRQQVLSPQVLDLSAVVEQMGDMLRRLIGENIRFVVRHDSPPCWVRVDRSQLEQVLLNLAVNARDAMPAGGTLTITTGMLRPQDGPSRAGKAELDGPHVVLCVHDDGVGMSSEVQARAFDPFFTTKGPGKGTGLGLSTVYGIVKQSGGSVWLESAPGGGTSVRIALPRWEAPAESAAEAPAAGDEPRAATLLVVEDEPAVRSLLVRTLKREGYQVLAAEDGARALEVARGHAGTIDLVITDVVMPNLGGREMAARLAAARPGLPFLFISGYPDGAPEAQDVGGQTGDFLSKPFAPDQLLARVRALLRARRPQAETIA